MKLHIRPLTTYQPPSEVVVVASHPDQIQIHDAHSFGYHITRLGHVFDFRFLVFEQKTTNGRMQFMYNTSGTHTH